ncbi:MAG TPA: helix-turn-helix transcriptional regulator [Trebonia sp.]|nr:helix-turn-helix transcriptional regulator [Trebonia sp.]
MSRQELACFLRDRREALRPADVGLPAGSRRRTPGLRREEVAARANMSVEYYARLEQGRGPRPSPPILDGVADALRLTPADRAHVFRLAGVTCQHRQDRHAGSVLTWRACWSGCRTPQRSSPRPRMT